MNEMNNEPRNNSNDVDDNLNEQEMQQGVASTDSEKEGQCEADSQTFTTDDSISAEAMQEDKKSEETTEQIPPIKKASFMNRHKSGVVLSGCFLLALVGGFGGTYAANQISGDSKVVLYQDTNTAKATNTSSSNATAMSVKEISDKAAASVVEIKTESVSTQDYFQQAITAGAGSGVILTKDGYIVTNNHVIEGANKVTVTTKDGKSYEAKLIGKDSSTDLAIIKIEANELTPAVMGSSSKLGVGDTAVAIGNPLGELGGTVTSGIISALDREITIDNQTMHLLQTSAAINPGNSGGGLFNDQGQLIGIVNAKSGGSNIEGLGFAIPIDRAKDIIENLIENGYVKGRASLGVTLSSSMNQFSNTTSAVYIVKVDSGKAADKAGLEAGDQILKVDDKEVTAVADIKTAVNSHKAGEKLILSILRNNETKTITVTLGEADNSSTSENNDTSSDSSRQQNSFSNNN